MPEDFNELELAVLMWFQTHYKDEPLSAQIKSARFLSRKWTEVGFYIDLEVSTELLPVDLSNFDGHWPIHGPEIRSADIQHGGGSVLWGQDGYITSIELYAAGDYFNEQVREFVLSPP